MVFMHPMLKMRMKKIVYLLKSKNATSEEKAVVLKQTGLLNPNFLHSAVHILLTEKIIKQTKDGKYYLSSSRNQNQAERSNL